MNNATITDRREPNALKQGCLCFGMKEAFYIYIDSLKNASKILQFLGKGVARPCTYGKFFLWSFLMTLRKHMAGRLK